MVADLLAQAVRVIFTTPSSAFVQGAVTKKGNAALHGMRSISEAAIAYVAMQVSEYRLL